VITLICGIPGHGKTLYAVSRIAEEAKAANRPVYYHGIPDCSVPGWRALDKAQDWYKLPPRSVVVVDEAHEVFPQRGPSMPVPVSVAKAALLRHMGIDLVLITQDGNSIDHFIRRRCGRYLHVWRTMGLQRATVWEFPKFCNWEDRDDRVYAVRRQFSYPKESFSLYKSAEVHTVKRSVPLKVLWFPLGGLAFVLALVLGYKSLFGGSVENGKAAVAKASSAPVAAPVSLPAAAPATSTAAPASPREYLAARIPRFQDFPESAPIYDKVASVVTFPIVSACVASASRCVCYTQQGTKAPGVSDGFCRDFVREGSFNPFQSPQAARSYQGREAPDAKLLTVPASSVGLVNPAESSPPLVPAEQPLTWSPPGRAEGGAKRPPAR